MASTTRASSFLPTIKCSNCSVEIPISMMGEHICAPAPPLPESRLRALDGPFAPRASKNNVLPPPPRRAIKTPPPRINVASTFDSFLNFNAPPPALPPASNSRSPPPAISHSGRKSPFQMPPRSATTPLSKPASSPSPDISISQDSAFPRFPVSKSRSVTPTTPQESSFSFSNRSKPSEQSRSDIAYAPSGLKPTRGGNVLQRMNSIAPGPFNTGTKGYSQRSGHKSSNSMSNSQDFTSPTSSTGFESHNARPSTSSSNYTRRPSISSKSGSSRFTLERSKPDIPAVPAVPSQGQSSQQGDSRSARNEHDSSESAFDFGSFDQDNRSQTFRTDDKRSKHADDHASFHRRPSEPSVHSHKPRPSVAATVMQPLYSIGSTSSFKPSKSLRGRYAAPSNDQTVASMSKDFGDVHDDKRPENAPPLPMPANVQDLGSEDPHHTPHESTSSTESYSSGRKTGSSRSSPPLHDSTNDSRIDNLFNGFEFDVERRPSFEEPPSIKEDTRAGDLKPRPSKPPSSDSPTLPTLSPYEKPPRRGEASFTSPEENLPSSFAFHSVNLRVSPAVPTLAPPQTLGFSGCQRPTTANKGNCRGCGQLIQGKSVRAEDGRRLTGRYHKQCFVCKTCQALFPTADFYVMHNHPYCARHYHKLNNSLCKNCDKGIEGPYLETEQNQKFHPHCFSCQECHRILRKDYFEFDGRTLCEQHAHRAAQQPSSLGPGRRFPERRTTRLMMM